MVTESASTFSAQFDGIPKMRAVTASGTCSWLSVTTARTLPWLESRVTPKSAIVGAAEVLAVA